MAKKSGKRRMRSDHYSLSQVVAFLMATSELWLHARRPAQLGYDLPIKPEGETEEQQRPSVVHADLLTRLRLSDPENTLIGLVDLEAAMKLIDARTREGISDFVETGPEHLTDTAVEFKPDPVDSEGQPQPWRGQRRHVLTVYRAINRMGEFKQEDRNAHDEGSRAGRVQGVPPAAA